jgi:competence protein ComEC
MSRRSLGPPGSFEPAPKPPPDLRLLSAAVGAWLGVLVASLLAPSVAGIVAACVLVGSRLARRRFALSVGLVMLAAGLAVGAVGRHSRTSGPLVDLAHRSGIAHVELGISSDPQPLPVQPHLPPGVVIKARLRLLDTNGRRWTLSQPVLVLAPMATWGRLLPSTRVAALADIQLPRGTDVAAVLVIHRSPVMIRGPSALQRWAGRIRTGLRVSAKGLPASERGLLPGLVVGDTSGMRTQDTSDFRAAGLTHLTAVSGANLAIVVAAVFWLLRWTPLGIRLRALSSAVVLLGFVALARPTPSVVRAAAMGLLALAAIGLGRPRALLPALLGTTTGLALFAPTLAVQPGFAMSVLATLALLVLAPGWTDRLRAWLPPRLAFLAPGLAAPLAAQVACAPVIASIGGTLGVTAVPANLLALPAVPLATVLGLLAALLSLASPGLAAAVCAVAGVPCRWLVAVAHVCAHLPAASLTVPTGSAGLAVVAVLAALAVMAVRRPAGRRTVGFALAILTAASLAGLR